MGGKYDSLWTESKTAVTALTEEQGKGILTQLRAKLLNSNAPSGYGSVGIDHTAHGYFWSECRERLPPTGGGPALALLRDVDEYFKTSFLHEEFRGSVGFLELSDKPGSLWARIQSLSSPASTKELTGPHCPGL
jgi:hypothetical protein